MSKAIPLFWTKPLEELMEVDEGDLRAELADYDDCELGTLGLVLHGLLQHVKDEMDRRLAGQAA